MALITREQDDSYYVNRDCWYYSGYGSQCRNYRYDYLESSWRQLVVKKKRITAETPSGPYHPGKCKLTNVLLEQIEDTEAGIDFYQPHLYPCHPRHFVGVYTPASLGLPGGLNPTYLDAPKPDYSLDRKLRMEAYSKLNSSGTGLSESLAEGGQVLSMLKAPLGGMAKVLKHCIWDAKRANFRTVKDASSAWLEGRYGWTPLYNTVKEMLKPLKTTGLLDVAASDTSEVLYYDPYKWKFPATRNEYVSFFGDNSAKVTQTHRHRLYYRVVDDQLYSGFHRGSTLFQLPQLAWELVPLSFVVDWWFSVGDYIAAHTPNPSVMILGETYSIKVVVERSRHFREVATPMDGYNPLPRYGPLTADFCVKRKHSSYRRIVPESLSPMPIVPSFNAAFKSVKHAADALGLIIQRVPRRR